METPFINPLNRSLIIVKLKMKIKATDSYCSSVASMLSIFVHVCRSGCSLFSSFLKGKNQKKPTEENQSIKKHS